MTGKQPAGNGGPRCKQGEQVEQRSRYFSFNRAKGARSDAELGRRHRIDNAAPANRSCASNAQTVPSAPAAPGARRPGYCATQPVGPIGPSARGQPFDFVLDFWSRQRSNPRTIEPVNPTALPGSPVKWLNRPSHARDAVQPNRRCFASWRSPVALKIQPAICRRRRDASFACTPCPQCRKSSGPRVGDEAPDQRRILDAACALHTR